MDDLSARLLGLANNPTAPGKVRKRAALLHERIVTPLRITIAGPNNATQADIQQRLPQDDDLITVVDDIVSADIAVWCTHDFKIAEAEFWDDAPTVLQDHSLLVGPPDPHVQSMGEAYFRQWCAPDQIVETLMRRIRHGRDADADQALALLARYPSEPVLVQAAPPKPADHTIATYLQTQADRLAAMDVLDTPESCAAVLNICAETAQHLSGMLGDTSDTTLQDAVFDAVDAITLMQLEGDIGAAMDAVTTLINLKMQVKNAAVSEMETCGVP